MPTVRTRHNLTCQSAIGAHRKPFYKSNKNEADAFQLTHVMLTAFSINLKFPQFENQQNNPMNLADVPIIQGKWASAVP